MRTRRSRLRSPPSSRWSASWERGCSSIGSNSSSRRASDMAPAILFDHVWKKFRQGERHDSLRDLIPGVARRLFAKPPPEGLKSEEFWALQDVSFAVEPGQALGIIGSN